MNRRRLAVLGALVTAIRLSPAGSVAESPAIGMPWVAGPRIDQCRPPAPSCQGRYLHSATVLSDGRVLLVGGSSGARLLAGTEIYDPASATWSADAPLHRARSSHRALLVSGGRVLVAGGTWNSGEPNQQETVELYQPGLHGQPGTWRVLPVPGGGHGDGSTATLLRSGRVLLTGGAGESLGTPSADLFDPDTRRWVATSPMSATRVYHAAALLPDGRVLVAGGEGANNGPKLRSAELYDPETGTWSPTGSLPYTPIRASAVTLPSGQVLLAGGAAGIDNRGPSTISVLYDPATGAWSPTGELNVARDRQTAVRLADGRVLLVGGASDDRPTAEIYDPSTRTWTLTPPMNAYRNNPTATVLPGNGPDCLLDCAGVLVVGGQLSDLGSTEVLGQLHPPRSPAAPAGTASSRTPASGGSHPGWWAAALLAAAALAAGLIAATLAHRRRRSPPVSTPPS